MKDFENVPIKGYIYASRFIASWVREGGELRHTGDFREWLNSLGLTEGEIDVIIFLAENGKLELEMSAKAYLKKIGKLK